MGRPTASRTSFCSNNQYVPRALERRAASRATSMGLSCTKPPAVLASVASDASFLQVATALVA